MTAHSEFTISHQEMHATYLSITHEPGTEASIRAGDLMDAFEFVPENAEVTFRHRPGSGGEYLNISIFWQLNSENERTAEK